MNDLQSASHGELLELKRKLNGELNRRAYEHLEAALSLYIQANGCAQAGCEQACDDFFRDLARKNYPGGWNALLRYTMKAAG